MSYMLLDASVPSLIRDERLSLCLFNQDSPTNVTAFPL